MAGASAVFLIFNMYLFTSENTTPVSRCRTFQPLHDFVVRTIARMALARSPAFYIIPIGHTIGHFRDTTDASIDFIPPNSYVRDNGGSPTGDNRICRRHTAPRMPSACPPGLSAQPGTRFLAIMVPRFLVRCAQKVVAVAPTPLDPTLDY